MPRKAVLLTLLACVLFAGCGADITSVSVTRSAPGEVDIRLAGVQTPVDGFFGPSRNVTGPIDVLFAVRMPTGTDLPETFDSTGDITTTFRRDAGYTQHLNTAESAAGQTWVGYLSDDVDVDGDDDITIDLQDVALPGAVRAGTALLWLGGREGDARTAPAVDCSVHTCNADNATVTFDIAPRASISQPEQDVSYDLGSTTVAQYSCTNTGDAGSCTGTVPSGSPIDTATPGRKTFTVTASDGVEQTETTVRYTVAPHLVVTTTDDTADGSCADGTCSLRDAITIANGTPDDEYIRFAIPGDWAQTITTALPLPAITDAVTIDGLSQPGATANTTPNWIDARVRVRIDGDGTGTGLEVDPAAAGTLIRNVSVTGYETGVELRGEGSSLEGSFVGIDPDGARDDGITGVVAGAGATVGGTTMRTRNAISGQVEGVVAGGTDPDDEPAIVRGNLVGLAPTSPGVLGTPPGIGIRAAGPATIGGVTSDNPYMYDPQANYVIAQTAGIRVDAPATVRNNVIGQSPNNEAMSHLTMVAIDVTAGADGSAIGAASPTADGGNELRSASGIRIAADDVIVTANVMRQPSPTEPGLYGAVALPSAERFRLQANTFMISGGIGIDVGDDGPTANDDGDTDGVTNAPVVTRASSDGTKSVIVGTLDAKPDTAYVIDLVASYDAASFGVYSLGTATVTTDGDGHASWRRDTSETVGGHFVRATATPVTGGSTSEMSASQGEGSAPRIDDVDVVSAQEGAPVDVHLTVAADEQDDTEVHADCDGSGFPDAPAATGEDIHVTACTYDTPGPRTIRLKVTDEEGTLERDVPVTVADVATSATLDGPSSGTEGTERTFTYDAGPDAPEDVSASCGDSGELVAPPSGGEFTCELGGATATTVSFSATDDGDTATATKQVAITNVAPQVTIAGPATAREGETQTYTWTASDVVDDVTVTGDCGPGGTLVPAPGDAFACRFGGSAASTLVRAIADDGADRTTASRTVAIANVAPVAVGETFTTPHATALRGTVLGNDTDAGGDRLTAELVRAPAHGTVELAADGSFTYTPAAGFSGADGFAYRAGDGEAVSGEALVSIGVGAAAAPPPKVLPGFAAGTPTAVTSAGSGAVGRDGVLTLRVRNANPFWLSARVLLSGSVPGAAATRQLVGKDVVLAPGRTTSVRLRLDKRTRAALKRGRRIRARTAIALTDASGGVRRISGKVTLRAARR